MSDDRAARRAARAARRAEKQEVKQEVKSSPKVQVPIDVPMVTMDSGNILDGADLNGDGHISNEELEMHLEFKRKELEDADARRDAMRQMSWFALFGMLLYPFAVVFAILLGLDGAGKILGDMAATYFVSVAAIVMAFIGGNAYSDSKRTKK
jgi:hypothetical protein